MSEVGYGPTWPVDGPPPVPPKFGLLQAAAAPAAGVRIIPDVDLVTARGLLNEIEDRVTGMRRTGSSEADILAELYALVDAYAQLDGVTSSGVERWLNGIQVRPYPGLAQAGTFNACAPGSQAEDKLFGDEETIPLPIFGPITAYLAETCPTRSVPDQDAYKARATIALAAIEGAIVEQEFLSGDRILNNPHLADGEGEFPNDDTVTSLLNGVALLEGEIAKSGKLGLIHLSPMAATFLRGSGNNILDDKSGVLRTANGNVVIPGAGYVYGASPRGHADASDGEEWIYATGPIDVRRSEMFVSPEAVEDAVDRGTGGATTGRPNTVTYRAERYYLTDWDTTVQAAVLVDRCQTSC